MHASSRPVSAAAGTQSHRQPSAPSNRPASSGDAGRQATKQAPKRIRVIGARADVIEELTSPVKLPASLQAHAGQAGDAACPAASSGKANQAR